MAKSNNKKKVGIWIRVSNDSQVEADSPKRHLAQARAYIEYKDWEEVKVYMLEGKTGLSIEDYPETHEMMSDVRNGVISGLIFSHLTRLGRNTIELLNIADYFEEHDADLISISQSIDTSTAAGRMFFTILSALGEHESAQLSERVKASVVVRGKQGFSLGGQAPFGYSWFTEREDGRDKYLVVNPDEAAVRKLMMELYVKIQRIKTVANELNERGYRTRKGAKFSGASIRRLIEDPIVTGVRRVNYTKSTGKNKKWEIKDESEWIMIPVPRIVDDELFNEVQRIFKEKTSNRKKPSRLNSNLFTSVIVCGCGGKMKKRTQSKNYRCIECKNAINANDLEDIFREQLKLLAESPEEKEKQMQFALKEIKQSESLIKKQKKERKKIKTKLDNLLDMITDGHIKKESFESYHEPLKQQYDAIEEEIAQLEVKASILKSNTDAYDHVFEEAVSLFGRWNDFSPKEKRIIIDSIVESITVHEIDVDIVLHSLTPPTHLKTSVLIARSKGMNPHRCVAMWSFLAKRYFSHEIQSLTTAKAYW